MKKRFLIICLFLPVFLAGSVCASPIRYSITKGNDYLGNPFNGFVDIEEFADTSSGIRFGITAFSFNTVEGTFWGNSGYLDFGIGPWPNTISVGDATAHFSGIFTEFGGINSYGLTWDNDMTGVWFCDENSVPIGGSSIVDKELYSILPTEIMIYMDCMPEHVYHPELGESAIFKNKSVVLPVPEPSSALFLAFGLMGWAGNRVRRQI